MLEIIRSTTGESIVYTTRQPLDAAYAAGVPELLILNAIHHVLDGDIEPVITDGGLRFTVRSARFTVNFYDNRVR